MNIEQPREFAKQLQDVMDTIDAMKNTCLPTYKHPLDILERKCFKLMSLVDEPGASPEKIFNEYFDIGELV